MKLSRRQLLGLGAAGAVGLVSPLAIAQARGQQIRFPRGRRPKNVIFFVFDGMAMSVPTMVDHFRQLTDGKHSLWAEVLKDPRYAVGLQDTRSLSSVVTDSSAAASTWGSGRLIWNGQLNIYPDGTELKPLTKIMSEAGVKCGLVTTTTMTHATPAGFAVSCIGRDLQPLIAEKYLECGVDVFFGGGDRFFNPARRTDKKDVYAEFAKRGFKVVKTRDEIAGLRGDKLLGIFSDSHIPYTVDRNNDPELRRSVPTLAEMTACALENLKGTRNGFLLQVEAGKVDHAAHGNDLAGMFWDQMAGEDALRVCFDFAQEHGDTLVIATADHACGGPSLNGAGDEYFDSTAGLKSASNFRASYDVLIPLLRENKTRGHVQDVIEDRLAFKLSAKEADAIVSMLDGKSPFGDSSFFGGLSSVLGMILGNHNKVTWTSGNHTADHVLVTGFGPGSELVAGLTQNTQFFDLILATKGLRHENPRMSFEDAKRAHEKAGGIPEELSAYLSPDDDCMCHS